MSVNAEDLKKIDDLLLNRKLDWPRMALPDHDDMIDAISSAMLYGQAVLKPRQYGTLKVDGC